jgi:hypothetical protein
MLHPCRNLVQSFALALFLVSSARAWEASSEDKSKEDTSRLEGIVINTLTGRPISRALVHLLPWRERAMLTDPKGEFSFDHVPQGLVQILVTKPGFVYRGTSTVSNTPSSIHLGTGTSKVALKLTPAAVIYGQVTNKDEEPVEGVSVEVLGAAIVNGRRQLTPVRNDVRSDAEGNFRVAGLVPGRYYVAVKAGRASPNSGLQSAATSEAYPELVYYPSRPDLDSAAPLDLSAGQHAEVRFVLEPVPSFRLAGFVGNLSGWSQVDSPVFVDESGRVLLQPDDFNRQTGAFEFRAVPAGTYMIRVGATNQESRHTFTMRKVKIEANITDLHLLLNPGVDIPVVVRTEFGRPQAVPCKDFGVGKNPSDCNNYPAARVELHSLDSISLGFYSELGLANSSPSLNVRGVIPGTYLVDARATFGGYVQSIRSAGLDLMREPLVVPEGARMAPIEVVVRDDAATVTIQVRTDKPNQQLLVLVLAEPTVLAGPQVIATGGAAAFQSGPLPPGVYKIFAFDAADSVEYTNSDVLAKYAPQAATVNVAAGGSVSATVDVIHIGE